MCDFEKLPDLCRVLRKFSETVDRYKYTSTDRKASNGEMITMFRHQNTAANYVKIITMSKSMSGKRAERRKSNHTLEHQHSHTRYFSFCPQ